MFCVLRAAWAQQAADTPTSKELVEAIRSGGVQSAAALVGHYVSSYEDSGHMQAANLAELAHVSDAVVHARVTSKAPAQVTADGSSITTDFVATVLERFQGPVNAGAQMTVRTVGGLVRFADGTTAEIRSTRVPPLQIGEEYVFFLRSFNGMAFFQPRNGYESQFWLGPTGTFPRARSTAPLYQQYAGMAKLSFLNAVRASSTP